MGNGNPGIDPPTIIAAMFDLVIRTGSLVTPAGVARRSVGITNGRIAAVLDSGEAPPARETIDADGKMVLPGLVDSHVHFREPGLVHKEGFASGSRSAAAGGVTTVMVMPTDNPMTTTPELFLEKKALAAGACWVDFALQAGLGPDTRHVRALIDLGAVSFEIFLADLAPPMLVDRSSELLACLAALREVNGVAGITPGDDSIVQQLAAMAQSKDPTDRSGFTRSRPPIAEAMSIARVCLAASETSARAHVRQVSCVRSVAVLRGMAPAHLSSEVTPHNLTLDETELIRQGPVAKVSPPLRSQDDIAALRSALRDGTIDIVATDHAPHLPEEKHAGDTDIWKAPGGFPGLQTFLPLMLRLVGEGVLDYPGLVRACCEGPSRLFGIYPKKGTLEVGSDADVVIIDPNKPLTIRNQDQQSKARLTPFDGWIAPATPELVLLRGTVVMRGGRPEGAPRGRFVAPSR
jgi:dihydroorotase